MHLLLIVKWIHVMAAIAAVGANVTYGIWISRAARTPSELPFVLHTIRVIDSRLANPCYGLLLLTGLVMAYLVPIPLTTPWLMTAVVLYVLAAFLGVFAYAPTMRDQRKQLEIGRIRGPGLPGGGPQGDAPGHPGHSGCDPDRLSDGSQTGAVGLAVLVDLGSPRGLGWPQHFQINAASQSRVRRSRYEASLS